MGKNFPHAFGVTVRRSRTPEGQSPDGERTSYDYSNKCGL